MSSARIENWKSVMKSGDMKALGDMIADTAVFISPVVYTPQKGKAITKAYLTAAHQVLGQNDFRYQREYDCGDKAVLEFTCMLDGIEVNGVDMIDWNDDDQITSFKVMIRPLRAINKVHEKMGQMLAENKG